MATKKKSKKPAKSNVAARKKAAKKKPVKKVATAKKNLEKKKAPPKKATKKKKAVARKKPIRGKSQSVNTVAFEPAGTGARSGGQSGDLEGLSNNAHADSESVDELLEEGNAFEAELVKGVEDAPDPDQAEVHTHELLEDDVPGEYDDQ